MAVREKLGNREIVFPSSLLRGECKAAASLPALPYFRFMELCLTLKFSLYFSIASDNKLGGAVEGKEILQIDLDILNIWAIINWVKFSKNKYWIPHLGQGHGKRPGSPD